MEREMMTGSWRAGAILLDPEVMEGLPETFHKIHSLLNGRVLPLFKPRKRVEKCCWNFVAFAQKPQIIINGFSYTPCRVAWEVVHGELERAKTIRHTCGNMWCVNPAHMEAIAVAEVRQFNQDTDNRRCVINRTYREEIRALRRDGQSISLIADEFGISYSYAWAIINSEERVD